MMKYVQVKYYRTASFYSHDVIMRKSHAIMSYIACSDYGKVRYLARLLEQHAVASTLLQRALYLFAKVS